MKIDLRSDTVTQPTPEMRDAMASAEVGDDVYGDDPTVNRLEAEAAALLKKEAALFVPSGTMGNQIAVMTHTKRGDEVIVDEYCHIFQHEVGAAAVISGVTLHCVPSVRGMMEEASVKRAIRAKDIHYPDTTLLCLENAHSLGFVQPISYMAAMRRIADDNKLKVHLDGARLFNAAESLGCSPADIAGYVDSVTFCLSKGLCAPVGSILCGTTEFIDKARKNRKLLGGGMRQAGILAAAGLVALSQSAKRLSEDHKNARLLAEKLAAIQGVTVDKPDINMVFFNIAKTGKPVDKFAEFLEINGILNNCGEPDGTVRFVTHMGVAEEDIDYVLSTVAKFLNS